MPTLAIVAYTLLGLFQLAAVIAGLEIWMGLPLLIAVPLAFFIAYFPVIGTLVGMFGAVTAWHWSWLQAFLLFFGPLVLIMAIYFGSAARDKFGSNS